MAACALGVLHAAVLLGVAAGLVYEQTSGTGNIASEHLDGPGPRGRITVVLLFVLGAGLLVAGA